VTRVGPTATLVLAVGVLLVGACGGDGNPDRLETGADAGTSTTAAATGVDESTAAATAGTAATAMAEDTACTGARPRLHVVNATGNAVAEDMMLAYDPTDEVSSSCRPAARPPGGEPRARARTKRPRPKVSERDSSGAPRP
jgi:hypothetical protein